MKNMMKLYFPLAVIIYGCFTFITMVDPANGYFARTLPGIECISNYPEGTKACDNGNCNFKDPNNVFKFACDTDCRANHGAAHGYCLESGICNCGPSLYTTGEFSLHCRNISQAELFQTICDEDCKCLHNKIGGGCNFWTKSCECGPTNESPTLNCPYKNSNEYFLTLIERCYKLGFDPVTILSDQQ